MKLSRRLEQVASMVTKGNRVADVGCDHGFVPIRLVLNQTAPSAIAADVRRGPLERAKEHIREYGLENKIETRLSDGLERILPGEADCVVMSGIGGQLMVRILKDSVQTARSLKELVLSPQSELELVREYLASDGFTIDYEHFLQEEGKYYSIFHVIPVQDTRTWKEDEYYYGRDIAAEDMPVLKEYLKAEYRQKKCVYDALCRQPQSQRIEQRKEELIHALKRIETKQKKLEGYINEMQ